MYACCVCGASSLGTRPFLRSLRLVAVVEISVCWRFLDFCAQQWHATPATARTHACAFERAHCIYASVCIGRLYACRASMQAHPMSEVSLLGVTGGFYESGCETSRILVTQQQPCGYTNTVWRSTFSVFSFQTGPAFRRGGCCNLRLCRQRSSRHASLGLEYAGARAFT